MRNLHLSGVFNKNATLHIERMCIFNGFLAARMITDLFCILWNWTDSHNHFEDIDWSEYIYFRVSAVPLVIHEMTWFETPVTCLQYSILHKWIWPFRICHEKWMKQIQYSSKSLGSNKLILLINMRWTIRNRYSPKKCCLIQFNSQNR